MSLTYLIKYFDLLILALKLSVTIVIRLMSAESILIFLLNVIRMLCNFYLALLSMHVFEITRPPCRHMLLALHVYFCMLMFVR